MFNTLYFGINHEGNGGWTSKQILNNIPNWLAETGPPDIVRFSVSGENDALQNLPYEQTISIIYDIVIALQDANPEVTILFVQLAPARSDAMNAELSNYFNQLTEDVLTIASESTAIAPKVIAIAMFKDFQDRLQADDVHYNEMGADFIASSYYAIL
jgi:lysophospholipase L1-like esterase